MTCNLAPAKADGQRGGKQLVGQRQAPRSAGESPEGSSRREAPSSVLGGAADFGFVEERVIVPETGFCLVKWDDYSHSYVGSNGAGMHCQ